MLFVNPNGSIRIGEKIKKSKPDSGVQSILENSSYTQSPYVFGEASIDLEYINS